MKSHFAIRNTLVCGITLAASALATSPGRTDITGQWTNPGNWQFNITGMTDIDQFRFQNPLPFIPGLPNGGRAWCAPTSAMDMLAYINGHGYPKVPPYVKDWSNPNNYNLMTTWLAQMGTLMNTAPDKGTGSAGWMAGVKGFLAMDQAHKNDFVVAKVSTSKNSPIRINQAAKMVANGSLASICFGFYHYDELETHQYVRRGGHVVTLQGGAGNGLSQKAWFADPAVESTKNFFKQSPFAYQSYDFTFSEINHGWIDNKSIFHHSGHLERVENWGAGGEVCFDGALFITPVKGLTAIGSQLSLYSPVNTLGGNNLPVVTKLPSGDRRPVTSLAMDPVDTRHAYLTDAGDRLWEVDMATGATIAGPLITGAQQVVIGGPDRNRFVLTNTGVEVYSKEHVLLARQVLSEQVAGMAIDETNQRWIVLVRPAVRAGASVGAGKYVFGDLAMQEPPRYQEIGSIPAITGTPSMKVDVAGNIYLHLTGEKQVRRLSGRGGDVGEIIRLQGAAAPTAMTLDDEGRFLISDKGVVRVFERSGLTSSSRFPLKGIASGNVLDVLRSYTNVTPEMETSPSFIELLEPPR